jgi:hypothetical protein
MSTQKTYLNPDKHRDSLKKAYQKAVNDDVGTFVFNGVPTNTQYAKYVLEYWDSLEKTT